MLGGRSVAGGRDKIAGQLEGHAGNSRIVDFHSVTAVAAAVAAVAAVVDAAVTLWLPLWELASASQTTNGSRNGQGNKRDAKGRSLQR
jgi:hypothetical protein